MIPELSFLWSQALGVIVFAMCASAFGFVDPIRFRICDSYGAKKHHHSNKLTATWPPGRELDLTQTRFQGELELGVRKLRGRRRSSRQGRECSAPWAAESAV